MKWITSSFILLFQFSCLVSFSQRNKDTRIIMEAGDFTGSFEEIKYYKTTKIPFRDILVFDKRFDSSKLGYTNSDLRIHPGSSWSSLLNGYFRDNLDPSSDKSLVIFIRSYWLQKGITDKVIKKKIIQKPVFGGDEFNLDNGGSCSASIDIFSKSDSSFQTLFKIDTFFLNTIVNFRKNKLADFFFLPFDSVIRKIAGTDIKSLFEKRRKISWNELIRYYDSRFHCPLLNGSFINNGIFLSFEDFKKNKPLATDFRLKEGNLTDELYKVNGQNEEMVADYWGFFDGSSLYIKAGFSAFKAVKQQNSFEIYGALQVGNYHDNPQPGDLRINVTAIQRKILQVNMDTGEFY